jgi:predicted acylesterase/phospholipase RssA
MTLLHSPTLNGETEEQAKALVLASMAFPAGVFRRVKIGKFRYMDGGASDNTPIYPLLVYNCKNLFVAHLRPVPWERGFRILHSNSLRYWLWEINLLMERIGEPVYQEILFRPLPRIIHIAPEKCLGFGLLSTFYFSKKKSKRLIDQGYRDTIEVLTDEGFIRR